MLNLKKEKEAEIKFRVRQKEHYDLGGA